ncbi:MAG: cyclic pyranopterin monophosphate synthase MoaC [Clostridia bacterium]|nr:cyclic pyranopterin monophosphate synthase MoaC [Clostridia bacterium]MBT7122937.1 cyclic pyranopterin monophosphate synthase MoaC [Clostridia bacterium]
MTDKLTHFNENGKAEMVDVTDKQENERTAVATGRIIVNDAVFDAITNATADKGDVLGVARVAGIMATKRTFELIPLCHPLMLTKVSIEFKTNAQSRSVDALCTAKVSGKTGVEMEALTGVSVSLLTIYDMCKALDKTMEISNVHLVEKSGGKSGHFINDK